MSSKGKEQELKKNINKATESTKESIDKASDAAQSELDKASKTAQDEVVRLRRELDDLRRKANPQIKKAEAFLTSPTSCSFYQGKKKNMVRKGKIILTTIVCLFLLNMQGLWLVLDLSLCMQNSLLLPTANFSTSVGGFLLRLLFFFFCEIKKPFFDLLQYDRMPFIFLFF